MVLYRSQLAVLGLALALSGTVACGDDGDKDDGNGGGDGSADGDSETFDGVVVDSTNIESPISGAKTYLFNLETGEIDMDSEQVSDSNGRVTFTGNREDVGIFVQGDGQNTQDTWNFPPPRTGEEEIIRVGSTAAATTVPVIADYPTDQEAAPLAGSVLWLNPETQEHEFVGCARIVEEDGVEDARYFKDNLPTNLAVRSAEQGTVPPNGQGTNDGAAGKYFLGNVAGGTRTIKAMIGDMEIGSVTLYVTPRSEGGEISNGMTSNLMLANLLVSEEFTENPTPADCE